MVFKVFVVYGVFVLESRWGWNGGFGFCSTFGSLTCVSIFQNDLDFFKHVQAVTVARRMGRPEPWFAVAGLYLNADKLDEFFVELRDNIIQVLVDDDEVESRAIHGALQKAAQKFGTEHAFLPLLEYITVTGSKALGDGLTYTDLQDIQSGWDNYAKGQKLQTVEASVKDFKKGKTVKTWDENNIVIGGEEYTDKPSGEAKVHQ
jgi:hypothetical protein